MFDKLRHAEAREEAGVGNHGRLMDL